MNTDLSWKTTEISSFRADSDRSADEEIRSIAPCIKKNRIEGYPQSHILNFYENALCAGHLHLPAQKGRSLEGQTSRTPGVNVSSGLTVLYFCHDF